jgi:hypothetical protein
MNTGMLILTTAVATSATTLALAYALYALHLRAELDRKLLAIEDAFEQRVKAGMLAAGRELLPELRKEVSEGFRDVLKASHAAGIAEGTAKVVAGSTELLVDSLSNLLGLRKKP